MFEHCQRPFILATGATCQTNGWRQSASIGGTLERAHSINLLAILIYFIAARAHSPTKYLIIIDDDDEDHDDWHCHSQPGR